MDKAYVLRMLKDIENKYSQIPESNKQYRMYGVPKYDDKMAAIYNPSDYPGMLEEIDDLIEDMENLKNDLDIAMEVVKMCPQLFKRLGEDARENFAVFLEACKGKDGTYSIDGFDKAGENILYNQDYMVMVVQVQPGLYKQMSEDMKQRAAIVGAYAKTCGRLPTGLPENLRTRYAEEFKEDITYKVAGMREETFMGQYCDGHNCDFTYTDAELPKKIICCTKGDKKYEIGLYEEYGECPSGWTTASWGHIEMRQVEEFGEITKIPKKELDFQLEDIGDEFSCEAFSYVYDGGDAYYPMGYVGVNEELFIDRQQISTKPENEEPALEEIADEHSKATEDMEEDITYKIVGMREETYIGEIFGEYNDEFTVEKAELKRNVICCTKGGKKFEVELSESFEPSPIGEGIATRGHMIVRAVDEFGEITQIPIKELDFQLEDIENIGEDFSCEAFSYSADGGNKIDPMGEFEVNQELFMDKQQISTKTEQEEQIPVEQLPEDVADKYLKSTEDFNTFITQTKDGLRRPALVMGDGTKMSVQASAYHYCEPRKSGLSSYDSYEVGYPSAIIEQLIEYTEMPIENKNELLQAICPFVPRDVIIDILTEHGGINLDASLHPEKKLEGLKQEKSGMESKNEKVQKLINQFMAQLGNILNEDEPDIK